MSKIKAFLLLHGIVFLWGFTGILGKLLPQEAIIIVWYRVVIASLTLALFLRIKKTSFQLQKHQILPVVAVGTVVALHWITFYYAIQKSTASLGILCLSTTTLQVVWLEPLLLKTPFHGRKLVFSLLVVLGVAFIARDFKGQLLVALELGLFSALLAGVFSVSNAKLSQTIPSTLLSFYELATGGIIVSLVLLVSNKPLQAFALSLTDGLWLLFLGIGCTSFAFVAAIYLVKLLGAYTVSLTINLEPVYTICLAAILLGEHQILSLEFYVGAAVIVAVLLLNAWWNREPKKRIA
jgi:drug/metabolite transporter (DMT)-like permease